MFVLTESSSRDGRRDVTDIVKAFYEKTPFPNYDDVDNQRALLEKARAGTFARLLNEQIPYGARVRRGRVRHRPAHQFPVHRASEVLGIDVCLNSLRLAQGFKSDARPGTGDVCADESLPAGAASLSSSTSSSATACSTTPAIAGSRFSTIGRLVKPGGHLVVGLYSAYSRKLHAAGVRSFA